ncbi:MAG: hypothetical protein QOJ35_1910 [Solirubrobacteraceae bacterium]|jgi:hypothetical protein|nr:hypothetical protein [Solirubrobacteraceae bacterium]
MGQGDSGWCKLVNHPDKKVLGRAFMGDDLLPARGRPGLI